MPHKEPNEPLRCSCGAEAVICKTRSGRWSIFCADVTACGFAVRGAGSQSEAVKKWNEEVARKCG